MNDRDFMEIALAEAEKGAAMNEIPVGAVVVYDGNVLCAAHNMCETWKDATAHAEMLALKEACRLRDNWRLNDVTLYVTLEPCAMCSGAILNSRVGRLVFGCHDSQMGGVESVFNILTHPHIGTKIEVVGGVMEEDCKKVLTDFFAKKRTVK